MAEQAVTATSGSTSKTSRLIISIDVGITQSAVAVAYLPPDERPLVEVVDRWPAQESAMHLARVPTAVLYDEKGNLLACGAEAVAASARGERYLQEQLEHFKMQLHPTFNPSAKKWPFQSRKPAEHSKIYADYLRYLLQRTQDFLRDVTGQDVWSNFGHQADIVLSHPNRWGKKQQKYLEEAAIQAGLVTREGAEKYLHFVEEAEAAASFALLDVNLDVKFENGTKFVVCDAGGSTVDISAYVVNKRIGGRLDVEELDAPSCLDAGGVHVDRELVMHLYDQLFTERYFREQDMGYVHDIVSDGLKDFQENGKQSFSLPTDPLKVFLGECMHFPSLQLDKGVMSIEASKADAFFKTFVEPAVEEITRRVERHQLTIIILSGGFSQSPYFQRAVRDRLDKLGRTIVLAIHPTSKAVAVGALTLVVGGEGSTTVTRKPRPWKMWLTNFRKGLREVWDKGNA